MKTFVGISILFFLSSCNRNYEVTYFNNYSYNNKFIDTFNVSRVKFTKDTTYKLDKFLNRKNFDSNKETYKIKVLNFKNHEYLQKNDPIDYYGYYNLNSSKIHFFIDKNEYITCLYLGLQNNESTTFLTIDTNIIDSESTLISSFKDNYILLKNIVDHSYDIIDLSNPNPINVYIKYVVLELRDNKLFVLNKKESEKILKDKFNENLKEDYKII